jgi:hypothetical protein
MEPSSIYTLTKHHNRVSMEELPPLKVFKKVHNLENGQTYYMNTNVDLKDERVRHLPQTDKSCFSRT